REWESFHEPQRPRRPGGAPHSDRSEWDSNRRRIPPSAGRYRGRSASHSWSHPLDDQRGVRPAEAEAEVQTRSHVHAGTVLIGRIVEIATLVRATQIDGRRNGSRLNRFNAKDRL